MPTTVINSNATTQLKNGPGYLESVFIANAGATWTVQFKDGPDAQGTFKTIVGAAAMTVPAAGQDLVPDRYYFGQGLQVVTAGTTPGELDVNWS